MRLIPLAFAVAVALTFLPSAQAEPAVAPCNGPNEHIWKDLEDTREDPLQPECGSLSDPCWQGGGRCGGCGPPIVEWVVGPIYCL